PVQSHEALDGGERQRQGDVGVGGGRREGLRGAADDEALLFGVVADERGEGLASLVVAAGDQGAVGGVQHSDDAVGGAEVDADGRADTRCGAREGGWWHTVGDGRVAEPASAVEEWCGAGQRKEPTAEPDREMLIGLTEQGRRRRRKRKLNRRGRVLG